MNPLTVRENFLYQLCDFNFLHVGEMSFWTPYVCLLEGGEIGGNYSFTNLYFDKSLYHRYTYTHRIGRGGKRRYCQDIFVSQQEF